MDIRAKYGNHVYIASTIKNNSIFNIGARISKLIIKYGKVIGELSSTIETEDQLERLKNGENPIDVLDIREHIF